MLALLFKLILILLYHALLEFAFTELRRSSTRADLLSLEQDTVSLRECLGGDLVMQEILWVLPFHFTCPLKGVLSLRLSSSELGAYQNLGYVLVPCQGKLLLLLIDLEKDALPD